MRPFYLGIAGSSFFYYMVHLLSGNYRAGSLTLAGMIIALCLIPTASKVEGHQPAKTTDGPLPLPPQEGSSGRPPYGGTSVLPPDHLKTVMPNVAPCHR